MNVSNIAHRCQHLAANKALELPFWLTDGGKAIPMRETIGEICIQIGCVWTYKHWNGCYDVILIWVYY